MTKVTLHPTTPLNDYAKNHLNELSFGKETPQLPKKNLETRDLNWFGRFVKKIDASDTLFTALFVFSTLSIVGLPFVFIWMKEHGKQSDEKEIQKIAVENLNLATKQLNQKANLIERLQIQDFEKIPILDLSGKVVRNSIDYLQPEDLSAPIMKGLDQTDRPFIALKLEQPKKMVVTLFQRDPNSEFWMWDSENAFKHYFWEEIHSPQIYSEESYEFFRKIINHEHEKFVLAKV